MASVDQIPFPQSGMDSFEKGLTTSQSIFDSMMRNKLYAAQAKEALGKGAQSQMLANIIGQMTGQNPSGMGSDNSSPMNGGGANKALMVAGALGLPTQVVEGNLITPFGTFKVGESPQEKRMGESQQNVKEKSGAADITAATDYKKTADELKNTYDLYKQMQALLVKRPDLTGLLQGARSSLNTSSDPDLAAFIEKATEAQASLARMGSQRGGQFALQFAKQGKPGPYKQVSYNQGMINSRLERLKQEYGNLNKNYKDVSSKDLDQLENENVDNGNPSYSSPNVSSDNVVTLKGGLIVPKSFKSQKDFKDWYFSQPKSTQLAYAQYIKGMK